MAKQLPLEDKTSHCNVSILYIYIFKFLCFSTFFCSVQIFFLYIFNSNTIFYLMHLSCVFLLLLLDNLNGPQPSLILLITPVIFLLIHVCHNSPNVILYACMIFSS